MARSLGKWRTLNRRWKKTIDEAQAPDPNEEYLLYQILLGSLPLEAWSELSDEARAGYIERIQHYMTKAMKEAKVNTSWVQPNEEWDGLSPTSSRKSSEPSPQNRFLETFLPLAEEVAKIGAINSLAQTLLKLTLPGVPDYLSGQRDLGFQPGRSG